jgi:tetratricopeptide (TPR) repeat protein
MLSFRTSVFLGALWWTLASHYSTAAAKPPRAPSPSANKSNSTTTPSSAVALRKSYAEEKAGNCKGAALTIASELAGKEPRYFLLARLGYLEACAKNFSRAAVVYAQAAALDSKGVEALLGEQQALIALGRYREAEPVGLEIVRRDSNNYFGNSRLAWTLYNLGHYARSVASYQKLVGLYPGDIEMQLGLGWALFKGGRKREAAEKFAEVLAMSPDHTGARQGLSLSRQN